MAAKTLNRYILLTLLILILSSYFFAENNFKYASIVIAISSIAKFFAVSYQFMETKHAHFVWKGIIGVFAFIFFVSIVYFY